ncbi:MAG: ABC transporter ATP-binding protein [Trueperaceae bacterium]|nr:ABC transporter ATP-binding protein [Trueperaceae bacterium]
MSPNRRRTVDVAAREEDGAPSLRTAVSRMLRLMSADERRRLWWITPLITLNALIQVVGIASVMPFLALVADPTVIDEQPLLRAAYDLFRFENTVAFMVFTGIVVLVVLVASNAMAALTQLLMLRFSWRMNHSLSVRVLRSYLYKPYVFFLNQNTSTLAKNILGEVREAVSGFLVAGMNLVARVIVSTAILVLLVLVDPVLALVTFAFLGVAYGGFFMLVQHSLSRAGWLRSKADRERFKAASEALTGIKEIKLHGLEEPFLKRYRGPSRRYARYMARHQVITQIPRYAFETIAFGGMLVIVLFTLARGSGLAELLPTLGVYAFASYRLLPALQGVFSSMSGLKFSLAAVDVLYQDLGDAASARAAPSSDLAPMPVRERIALRDVTFAYPGARRPVVRDLDLEIRAKSTVAFVGATGAGKTTIVDLLLGLLAPDAGALLVDGTAVDDTNLGGWQQNLGYVPQEIYLADDTVLANIAFGVPEDKVDRAAVERAARDANIHDFIVSELPLGYDTEVGERGVRLSGGQRQRLGIARALFHDPDVLILDEATSALDNVTEENIFHAVRTLGQRKTVVMIAHRLSTVRDCDVIFLLDEGKIVARGTYDRLLETSPQFRALARIDVGEPHHATV